MRAPNPKQRRVPSLSSPTTPWRYHVRLRDKQLLRYWMDYRGYTNRSLAAACSDASRVYSHGAIDHLCSGYTRTCTPQLAHRIATALDVPTDMLFAPRSDAPRPTGRAA